MAMLTQTESVLLLCRGNKEHTYPPAAYATPNAIKWMENVVIERQTPLAGAQLMEGFINSGAAAAVPSTKSKENDSKLYVLLERFLIQLINI
jgi:hypothetical protein